MDNPNIPARDQERIDAMVASYRHQLENLYRMAYIQGQIDEATEARDRLRGKAA